MSKASPPPEPKREPDPERDPEPESDPGLPFLPTPTTVDPTIAVPEPVLTVVTTSEDEELPDQDSSRTTPPDPTPRTPKEILQNPAAAPTGAAAQWQSICSQGLELVDMGMDSQTTGVATRLALDRSAQVFRVSVSEFWSYSKDGIRAEIEAKANTKRLKRFDTVFSDADLVSALDAWSEARRGSPPDWTRIANTQSEVATQLTAFHKAVDGAYGGVDDIERNLLQILEAVGREVGREASEQVGGAAIDFGTAFGGVTYAVRLASPTEMVLQGARSVLAVQLASKRGTPGKTESTGGWVTGSIGAAKLPPSPPKGWAKNLGDATDAWVTAAKTVSAETVDALAAATGKLKKALADARTGVANAAQKGGAAPRVATRTLDALTEAVAEQLEAFEKTLGAAGAARLGPAAKDLRSTIAAPPTVTEPYSKFWSRAKADAMKKLPSAERKALDAWFSKGLGGGPPLRQSALSAWQKQVDLVPNHDHDTLLAQSWTIANMLNRYRVGILRFVSDPAARAPLFDTVDALATAVSGDLASEAAMYGDRL